MKKVIRLKRNVISVGKVIDSRKVIDVKVIDARKVIYVKVIDARKVIDVKDAVMSQQIVSVFLHHIAYLQHTLIHINMTKASPIQSDNWQFMRGFYVRVVHQRVNRYSSPCWLSSSSYCHLPS